MDHRSTAGSDRLKSFAFQMLGVLLLSCLLNFIIEGLSRHSLWEAAVYQGSRPLAFLYNSLIIACTLSPALLIKRQRFWLIL